jgi:hypothetical protein
MLHNQDQAEEKDQSQEHWQEQPEGQVMSKPIRSRRVLFVLALAIIVFSGTAAVSAQAATPPVKQVIVGHFGAGVDGSTGGNICTLESGDACRPGVESSGVGGFARPASVAAAPDGDVYVAERLNSRVQELTAAGNFVLMFGEDVNETTGGNTCTAQEIQTSGVKCKIGIAGSAAGQLGEPISVAVDPVSGNVYVAEILVSEGTVAYRVQEFTADGQFVLEIGRKVNEATKGNLCTEQEVKTSGVKCTGPAQQGLGSNEHGAFNLAVGPGDLLAVGGPEDTLYVGDEHRVQEFDAATGEWTGEVSLTSISSLPGYSVTALAVDENADVYLAYANPNVANAVGIVRKFTATGSEVSDGHFPLTLSPRETGSQTVRVENFGIAGLVVDQSNRLTVAEEEALAERNAPFAQQRSLFGSLLDAGTGRQITEFAIPGTLGTSAVTVNAEGDLYAAVPERQEVVAYKPVPVAELTQDPASCEPGSEQESDVTFNCALNGEANAEGVSQTEAWFQWGKTPALGLETLKQPILTSSALEPVLPAPVITGLHPNATYYERVAGYDENVKPPEKALSSETGSFETAYVAPKIVGTPSTPFVRISSAVMFGEVNPENARTTYKFQYGPCDHLDDCPGLSTVGVSQSGAYGKIGTTSEATGLQPATVYHYRLLAESENAGKTEKAAAASAEGTFTTGAAPAVQALTGPAGAVGATSATVSGTVNPDGQPATYAFELGVYQEANTRYGVVFSGAAGAGATPIAQTLTLSGLQPGTTYAYRIKITSGYGTATGAPMLFTTTGLPAVLLSPVSPALLAIPDIAFPAAIIPAKPKAIPVKKPKKKVRKIHKTKRGKARKNNEPRVVDRHGRRRYTE